MGNQSREGLSLSVWPRWSDAATGAEALWQEQVFRRDLPAAARDVWALDARAEYGTRLAGSRLLTWFGSLSQSADGRRRLGSRPAGNAGPSGAPRLASPCGKVKQGATPTQFD